MPKAHHHLGGVWDAELLENDDDLPVDLVSMRRPRCLPMVARTMDSDQSHGCRE